MGTFDIRSAIFINKVTTNAIGFMSCHETWGATLIGCGDKCQRHLLQRSDKDER